MSYTKTVKDVQASLKRSLIMLQSDPHFQEFVRLMEEGREVFITEACKIGTTQKDQDRLLGAINFANLTIQNAKINLNNGHGSRNTGVDSYEHSNRG